MILQHEAGNEENAAYSISEKTIRDIRDKRYEKNPVERSSALKLIPETVKNKKEKRKREKGRGKNALPRLNPAIFQGRGRVPPSGRFRARLKSNFNFNYRDRANEEFRSWRYVHDYRHNSNWFRGVTLRRRLRIHGTERKSNWYIQIATGIHGQHQRECTN